MAGYDLAARRVDMSQFPISLYQAGGWVIMRRIPFHGSHQSELALKKRWILALNMQDRSACECNPKFLVASQILFDPDKANKYERELNLKLFSVSSILTLWRR